MPDSPMIPATDMPAPGEITSHAPVTTPRRRFRQFGLRTLLVLMALCAAGFALYTQQIARYQRQRKAIDALVALGRSVTVEPIGPDWLRQITPDGLIVRVRSVSFSRPM